MKTRIAIAGIGGVGGFYGSKLANCFYDSENTEVYFLARGEHMNAIREKGLEVITDDETIMARPTLVSDNTKDFGKLDLIIFCCKSYDLESVASQFKDNIKPETLLLPLQNGVNSVSVLQSILPDCNCLFGCVYIVSKVIGPGIVKQTGSNHVLQYGNPALSDQQLSFVSDLFLKAGIHATQFDNIEQKVWEKFSFISPLATYTAAFNISTGKILEDIEHIEALKNLMSEVQLLAAAMKKELPADMTVRNFEMMKKVPYGTTSSMHLDFANGRRTELETLTGFVIKKAAENNIELKHYNELYKKLSSSI